MNLLLTAIVQAVISSLPYIVYLYREETIWTACAVIKKGVKKAVHSFFRYLLKLNDNSLLYESGQNRWLKARIERSQNRLFSLKNF